MAFPVSEPDDGLIGVVVMPVTTRAEVFRGSEWGNLLAFFVLAQLRHYKAKAYRVKLLSPESNLAVDGERFPFEEFQVEVYPRLGTFLSCYGRYAVDFLVRPET
ncbi:hypothetical protein FA13DRAFT_1727166 [Coprinellus micaceus]|uniref:Uncharacterized protein n=1 Tax=Coprinellus micaceus TaxID=71717 RepID=A0A4Y7TTB6_COPMI|nr:hypothetical protein FA13DRAFT_1727166 [Coprinellus micaceus]